MKSGRLDERGFLNEATKWHPLTSSGEDIASWATRLSPLFYCLLNEVDIARGFSVRPPPDVAASLLPPECKGFGISPLDHIEEQRSRQARLLVPYR